MTCYALRMHVACYMHAPCRRSLTSHRRRSRAPSSRTQAAYHMQCSAASNKATLEPPSSKTKAKPPVTQSAACRPCPQCVLRGTMTGGTHSVSAMQCSANTHSSVAAECLRHSLSNPSSSCLRCSSLLWAAPMHYTNRTSRRGRSGRVAACCNMMHYCAALQHAALVCTCRAGRAS